MADIKQIQISGTQIPLDIKDQFARDWIANAFDLLYPVGCYFETSKSTFDPNYSFYGTWVLETPGQVHVSGGTGYAVAKADNNSGRGDSDGGATTVTLTAAQMPAHTHTGGAHTHTGPSHTHSVPNHTHTMASAGAHTHTVNCAWRDTSYKHVEKGSLGYPYGNRTSSSAGSHAHTMNSSGACTTAASGTDATGSAGAVATTSVGGGGSHNNMQPYINVYRWHRVS